MSELKSRWDWSFEEDYNIFPSKKAIKKLYINKMLIRTQQMFKYSNLPETIPQRDLELILQCNGNATIAKMGKDLYAFKSGLGGQPNPYYLPTKSIIANPALNFNETLEIDKNCVVILNDSMYMGLYGLIDFNARLLAECDISFKFGAINSRIPTILATSSDNTKKSGDLLFKKVEDGENIGLMLDDDFIKNLSAFSYASKDTNIINLIELKQYIISTFFQDLGIQSQFNMKREAINSAESSLSEDVIAPLCEDMLNQRKIGLEKVNKMFGTNITVEFSSVWKKIEEKYEEPQEPQEADIAENNEEKEEENEQ